MKYCLLCILFFFISCKENNKKVFTQLLMEWQGKEILFPEEAIFTRFATDTIDYSIPYSEYKILVYVDSVGCTSCKLRLNKWSLLIEELDSLTNEQVPVLFFLQSRDLKEIKHLLKREQFDYPVCVDIENQINKINNFPHQTEFQTFLLDSNNQILLIGNPVHNVAVKELYLNIIKTNKH